jgi:hypothetical protein
MRRLLIAAIWLAVTPAFADIVQSSNNSSFRCSAFSPLGQSFTATTNETNVGSVSFMLGDLPNGDHPAASILAQVRYGIGFTGQVLGSQSLTLSPSTTPPYTWIDFNFATPITLNPGQSYTLQFSATNQGTTNGSYAAISSSRYSGGTMIFADGGTGPGDLAFRILNVPEPSNLVILVLGALLGIRHRRN